MKPLEVLAMLEEATGVRLYEDQKAKALKTLAQKQGKVDEMDKGKENEKQGGRVYKQVKSHIVLAVLREEITPTLEKRRAESEQYNRWVRNMQEVDRKRRLVEAFKYHEQALLLEKAKVFFVHSLGFCFSNDSCFRRQRMRWKAKPLLCERLRLWWPNS